MTDKELDKWKELTKAANGLVNSLRMLGKQMTETADYTRRFSEQVELTRAKPNELL